MAGQVKITQKKSTIGGNPSARRTMRTLGLKKIGESVTHEDSPTLRGMIRTVQHLIEVEEAK
jgi:large subunit ribosomal protein L30